MARPTYDQPEKRAVREAIWAKAIRVLTRERHAAAVVREQEIAGTITYAMNMLRAHSIDGSEVTREYEAWLAQFRASVGSKSPNQLRVLYLCGPEPLNDLNEMLAHGVSPHNVWAVESGRTEFRAALDQLERSGTHLKVHHGNVAEFFALYEDKFDIIYLDACGPFLGGSPSTFSPLLNILLQGRLEPLSVLITNFAEVPVERVARYTALMTDYFRYRYEDLPPRFWESRLDPAICEHEPEGLEGFIRANIEPFYSDFITRLVADLARYWLPNCRALANKDVAAGHHVERSKLNEVMASAANEPKGTVSMSEWIKQAGDLVLNPAGYPVLSFLRALQRRVPTDPLVGQLGNLRVHGHETHRLLAVAALLDHVVEGHRQILSEDLLGAIQASWFDIERHFSCDVPLPNLLINSLLGIYGRPYFPNPRATDRFGYCAKSTTMYTDLITFDQCRYYFDWFPIVQAAPARFRSISFQVVARCILDRIGRTDFRSSSHPFRGAAVACFGEIPVAKAYDFEPRQSIVRPPTA